MSGLTLCWGAVCPHPKSNALPSRRRWLGQEPPLRHVSVGKSDGCKTSLALLVLPGNTWRRHGSHVGHQQGAGHHSERVPAAARHSFGWSGTRKAIERLNEAVAAIERMARSDPALAGEGAVLLLEKLSPAVGSIDSSSGALGNATAGVVDRMVPLIVAAPVPGRLREKWLERLREARGKRRSPNADLYLSPTAAGPPKPTPNCGRGPRVCRWRSSICRSLPSLKLNGTKIVTRNVADFQPAGVDIFNPWE